MEEEKLSGEGDSRKEEPILHAGSYWNSPNFTIFHITIFVTAVSSFSQEFCTYNVVLDRWTKLPTVVGKEIWKKKKFFIDSFEWFYFNNNV